MEAKNNEIKKIKACKYISQNLEGESKGIYRRYYVASVEKYWNDILSNQNMQIRFKNIVLV